MRKAGRRESYAADACHVARIRDALREDPERAGQAATMWLCDALVLMLLRPEPGLEATLAREFVQRFGRGVYDKQRSGTDPERPKTGT